MPGGNQPGELHPGRGSLLVPALGAIAVHPAVEDDAGEAVPMGLEDRLDDPHVLVHLRGALVVHDDIEALGPIGVVVDGILVAIGLVRVVRDSPLDMRPRGDAASEVVLLPRVVVATTPEDEQQRPDPAWSAHHGQDPGVAGQDRIHGTIHSNPAHLFIMDARFRWGLPARRLGPRGAWWVGNTGDSRRRGTRSEGNPSYCTRVQKADASPLGQGDLPQAEVDR